VSVEATDGSELAKSAVRSGPARWLWFAVGWLSVAVGTVGVLVPGLPTTVFFIVAAACFTRSSPRFEQWVLGLPRIGPLVRDYRSGLGMPRRSKVWAISTMVVVGLVSVWISRSRPVIAATIVGVLLIGVWYVQWRVPTREHVLTRRSLSEDA
jgi:uncharacterized protein